MLGFVWKNVELKCGCCASDSHDHQVYQSAQVWFDGIWQFASHLFLPHHILSIWSQCLHENIRPVDLKPADCCIFLQEYHLDFAKKRLANFSHILFLEEFQEGFSEFARKVGWSTTNTSKHRAGALEEIHPSL